LGWYLLLHYRLLYLSTLLLYYHFLLRLLTDYFRGRWLLSFNVNWFFHLLCYYFCFLSIWYLNKLIYQFLLFLFIFLYFIFCSLFVFVFILTTWFTITITITTFHFLSYYLLLYYRSLLNYRSLLYYRNWLLNYRRLLYLNWLLYYWNWLYKRLMFYYIGMLHNWCLFLITILTIIY